MKIMDNFIQVLQEYQGQKLLDIFSFYNKVFPLQTKLFALKELEIEERTKYCKYIFDNYDNFHELIQIYLDSFLAYQFEDESYTIRLLDLVRKSPFLSKENWVYVYYQLLYFGFRIPQMVSIESRKTLREMYCSIYEYYKNQLQIKKNIVPVEKRNTGIVIFLISQFLSENHAPTKTVLNRSQTMTKILGMKTVIINTGEMVNIQGLIPFFSNFQGNYLEEMSQYKAISYKGYQFPFLQCSNMMPNVPEMQKIIELIKSINPYCIFHIGGHSFLADVCSNYYPLITVATVPSGITTTQGQFQLTGKKITKDDIEYVKSFGLTENHLQYCFFTWNVMEQIGKITRQQCGIPEDRFTVLVVGARLDFEIDNSFIEEVLLPVMECSIFIVFAGVFTNYEIKTSKYPLLKENSLCLGLVKDILALNEICDIYVNPKRTGGGTSALEAMIKGLPPVTLPNGDVALGAGKEFQVANYEEMAKQIIRLKEDREYYNEMSEKALARVKILTDTESAFLDAFHRIEKLEEFQ